MAGLALLTPIHYGVLPMALINDSKDSECSNVRLLQIYPAY